MWRYVCESGWVYLVRRRHTTSCGYIDPGIFASGNSIINSNVTLAAPSSVIMTTPLPPNDHDHPILA
jgi:hypothetical protein